MPSDKSKQTIRQQIAAPPISVRILETNKNEKKADAAEREVQFRKEFYIGRDTSCEVRIENDQVSRRHARVYFEDGSWWICDINSTNGIYLESQQVHEVKIDHELNISLGIDGPKIHLEVVLSADQNKKKARGRYTFASVSQYIDHYFGESGKKAGHHTQMIRSAYLKLQKQQKQKYYYIIGAIVVVSIFIAYFAYSQYRAVQQQKAVAQNIFYAMKNLELRLVNLQEAAGVSDNPEAMDQIEQMRSQQRALLQDYDSYLNELHIYDEDNISEEDRIILRIARVFGECEIGIPKNFIKEVKKYIKKWKSTERLENAIQRALDNNFHTTTAKIFLDYDLPPQFFYLALQESDFRNDRVGPKTRFGVAKGAWQFIPGTARQYGLRTGPLVELKRYDPRDERCDFQKATRAAAKYIHDLYKTEAQASGLLVFASYNWGQTNVRKLIRSLPNDPQQRNFWQLLKKYGDKIPQETYDYVFYIISAAVICEDPALFGFDFKNPFADLS